MTSEETYSSYVNSMTEKQLKEYLHTVGKAANQRLRELEKQGLQNSSAAYRYAAKIARDKDFAMSKTGAGEIKFNLRVRGRSFNELRHMVATVDSFMNAKTSTVGGIKDVYKQAADTFSSEKYDEFGNKIKDAFGTKEDYARFTEAMSYSLFRNFERIYGSQLTIQYMNLAVDDLGLLLDEIEKAIRDTGFTEKTNHGEEPPYVAQEASAIRFAENKKNMENNGESIFEANPLE